MAHGSNFILHRLYINAQYSMEECELVYDWFNELLSMSTPYIEPELDVNTVDFIKLACYSLKQDEHVFVMVVDVIERICYLLKATTNNCDILNDPFLLLASVILLCSKTVGVQCELKVKHIQVFLEKIGKHYDVANIKKQEIRVAKILGYNLPHTSVMDDLQTFLQVYVVPMKLRNDIQPICIEILQLIYVSRKEFYQRLKEFYDQNETGQKLFRHIVTKKLYIPAGITLCAFNITNYRNFLDLNKIAAELECILCIHKDNLRFLTDVIYDFISRKTV